MPQNSFAPPSNQGLDQNMFKPPKLGGSQQGFGGGSGPFNPTPQMQNQGPWAEQARRRTGSRPGPGGGQPGMPQTGGLGPYAQRAWMPNLFQQRMAAIAQLYGPGGAGWANFGISAPAQGARPQGQNQGPLQGQTGDRPQIGRPFVGRPFVVQGQQGGGMNPGGFGPPQQTDPPFIQNFPLTLNRPQSSVYPQQNYPPPPPTWY